MKSDSIVKEIYVAAPVAVVYEMLTDPDQIRKWMGPRRRVEISSRCYSEVERKGKLIARIVDLEPDKKWSAPPSSMPGSIARDGTLTGSVVEIAFGVRGEGTWVRLTHHGPLSMRKGSIERWQPEAGDLCGGGS